MKSRFFAFVIAFFITILIFVLPIKFGGTREMVVEQHNQNQLKFTLKKYNVINTQKQRDQKKQKSINKQKSIKQNEVLPKIQHSIEQQHSTEQSIEDNQLNTQDEKMDNQNESKSLENQNSNHDQKSRSIKKSKNKTMVYKPDFTIDKKPIYPISCRRMGQQGKVSVLIYVDKNGKIKNILPAMSSGYKALDDAAIAAIKCWDFCKLDLQDEINIIRTEVIFELN